MNAQTGKAIYLKADEVLLLFRRYRIRGLMFFEVGEKEGGQPERAVAHLINDRLIVPADEGTAFRLAEPVREVIDTLLDAEYSFVICGEKGTSLCLYTDGVYAVSVNMDKASDEMLRFWRAPQGEHLNALTEYEFMPVDQPAEDMEDISSEEPSEVKLLLSVKRYARNTEMPDKTIEVRLCKADAYLSVISGEREERSRYTKAEFIRRILEEME